MQTFFRLFPRRITTRFAAPLRKSVGVNCVRLSTVLGINIFFRLFPRRITTRFAAPLRKSVGVNCVRLSTVLGINTGTLSCIVKLPDEVCASHTKRVGENKKLQLKKFAGVLLTGLSF